ncbi:hypothetical protein [Embleya hyalina]|uniref:AraC family transcriptional regulator n=1 Tax=Embleya hyalina TaxID=516124 RepID=A0A401YMU5_9ACTN|nr:hypothetical protein [Embleya hyalina]GCD95911.1 AraC family transcriptional regulator [Embleya hyalina]
MSDRRRTQPSRRRRAAFAKRFTALVGEPPTAHRANRRITLASDLPRETDPTMGTIATTVGYANAVALGVAFERLRRARAGGPRNCATGADTR